jgi:thymidylate kinase
MTRQGMLFCFTGIDGSGKTTQARLLVDWLASRGVKSIYVWSRGEVLAIRRILLSAGRRAVGTSERKIASDQNNYREYQSRKSRLMSNRWVRNLWAVMTQIEHLVQINRDIRPKLRQGYTVVCDRYLWDSTIDMAVLNNQDHQSLLGNINKLMWKFVPKPTITFFIDIPPEEAMKRKDDIPSFDYVKKTADFYRFLSQQYSLSLVDGSEDITAIKENIRNAVTNLLEG